MAKKQFKAESKKLMELMINSIYTNKEIFLRELISNASDACDKLYYMSLTNNGGHLHGDFRIDISVDKESRILVITDNGIGMTKNELENNLGVIARSGSLDFVNSNDKKDDINIIGQFGVGFYSAFMVAEKIVVKSKPFDSEDAWEWCSEGIDGYTICTCKKESIGTEITLYIKPDTENEKYSEYLEEYRLKDIIHKYLNYIRYPIMLPVEKRCKKEGCPDDSPEWETYIEIEQVNSMIPIWNKNKNEIVADEYNQFYKDNYHDFENPLKTMHISVEGTISYRALLYIPTKTPYNYYTRDFEKGLQLYTNGVMIMEKCADLLPDYFGFVKGLVDSQDLSLNISREMLQHDRQLKTIASHLEKKIKSELESLLVNERGKYEEFFESFGLAIKYGVYSDYGMHKETLQDLILFKYSGDNNMITLSEYVDNMKDEQKYIYYVCGNTIDHIKKLPQTEMILDKGYNILYLTDDVDEFVIKTLSRYKEKEFRSVSGGDIGIEDEQTIDTVDNKDLLTYMTESLKDKVKEVKISTRLKTHPVCLSSAGDVSIGMEKVLSSMPNTNGNVHAEKILEINKKHPVFDKLNLLYNTDKEKLTLYAQLLYTQALMIEGLPIEDPVLFANLICNLMAEA